MIQKGRSPGYMAPEVWNAEYERAYRAPDADLFALGVILFRAMFKKCPFDQAKLEDQAYIDLIGRGDPNYWSFAENQCSEEFKNLIMNMLQYEPSGRL